MDCLSIWLVRVLDRISSNHSSFHVVMPRPYMSKIFTPRRLYLRHDNLAVVDVEEAEAESELTLKCTIYEQHARLRPTGFLGRVGLTEHCLGTGCEAQPSLVWNWLCSVSFVLLLRVERAGNNTHNNGVWPTCARPLGSGRCS